MKKTIIFLFVFFISLSCLAQSENSNLLFLFEDISPQQGLIDYISLYVADKKFASEEEKKQVVDKLATNYAENKNDIDSKIKLNELVAYKDKVKGIKKKHMSNLLAGVGAGLVAVAGIAALASTSKSQSDESSGSTSPSSYEQSKASAFAAQNSAALNAGKYDAGAYNPGGQQTKGGQDVMAEAQRRANAYRGSDYAKTQPSYYYDQIKAEKSGMTSSQQTQGTVVRGLLVKNNGSQTIVNIRISGDTVLSMEVQTTTGLQWFPVNKSAYPTKVEQDGDLVRYYKHKIYNQDYNIYF